MNILYEDRELLLCEKPAGLLSEEGGMPALLRERTGAKDIYCVHRLDREASGLMVYAKTRSAAGKTWSGRSSSSRWISQFSMISPI